MFLPLKIFDRSYFGVGLQEEARSRLAEPLLEAKAQARREAKAEAAEKARLRAEAKAREIAFCLIFFISPFRSY